ncbi:hypothetical protein ABE30_28815 [Bacillus tropicus]|uniref:phage tail domain-containing protein n=1 Tax=Bacillus cereus group TaxID=86661 RepID=UPI0018CDA890|nr:MULTISPECIES: phage tail domain-containing protein [Bacillus cereus group]MBG9841469.1 hypothetical protein [Bacillus tropicus]MBG9880761.1 hypothetical protein [Bacillus tropicus]MBG9923436.1 hypothetical protein [Bacillus tropicus]MBJ8356235.1 phage tail protein [Bacillus mycoides]
MITLDDKYRLEDFGFIFEPGYDDALTPVFDRKTYTIPGRPGAIPFGTETKERPFAYPLIIMERFHMDMQDKFRNLISFFFDEYGEPRKIKMIRDYEPDKFYYIELAQQVIPERLSEDGKLVLQLVAFDPYSYSIVHSTENVHWGDDIPFMSDIPFLLGDSKTLVTSPTSIEIENYGSLVVRPKVVIFGNAEGFSLKINGEKFYVGNFTQSTVTIDAETYTAIRVRGTAQSNILYSLEGNLEKLELFPGVNTIEVTGVNMNVTVDLQFRAKYK